MRLVAPDRPQDEHQSVPFPHKQLKDDETTASESDSGDDEDEEEEEDCITVGSHSVVSFAATLVTEIFERPRTSRDEKKELYYSRSEIYTFRKERNDPLVRFGEETQVFEYEKEGDKGELYYNESDFKRFLEDFVASVNASRAAR